ncbi:MAG: hypothetical protein A3D44_00705 [Candidatus Staskawiczbacteria bacterium RIFCSPHIGHO2_02_FULL_42_22]|uniref:Uncharacterized protein n=1 Tax=Candidatus Staskawiczbacteria bacterium RIFCSPHIGHO2_02_FULL_42_22 TaxID=1802207 RepID=A0A1G2I309_9BACT|nr:MAG: hypothetical protein A3D44_00705 [Candidatus Staskawiczbacteria bacterium RIFCSPHIGHO2_02_FULL_42_22]
MTKSFFKKSFESKSSALPKTGSIIAPGCLASDYGTLRQGEITDVKVSEDIISILVRTETAEEDLRGYLTSKNGWEEVSRFEE